MNKPSTTRLVTAARTSCGETTVREYGDSIVNPFAGSGSGDGRTAPEPLGAWLLGGADTDVGRTEPACDGGAGDECEHDAATARTAIKTKVRTSLIVTQTSARGDRYTTISPVPPLAVDVQGRSGCGEAVRIQAGPIAIFDVERQLVDGIWGYAARLGDLPLCQHVAPEDVPPLRAELCGPLADQQFLDDAGSLRGWKPGVRVGVAAARTLIPMSRRPDPERIYQAHRAGTLERLVSAGIHRESADAALALWEAKLAAAGRRRDELDWDAAYRSIVDPGPMSPSS